VIYQHTSRNTQPLTIDQIARVAPSALAVNAHESRSSRYTYLPTVEIIEGMQKAGFLPFSANQSRTRDDSRSNHTKHMIRFRHVDAIRPLAVGDSLPEIVLINSHDGTSAYKLIAGVFRILCGNGMIVAESVLASISVQHKGSIIDNVIEGSLKIAEQSQGVLDTVKKWGQLQLTAGEQSAYAEAAHTLRFGDSEGVTTTPITAAQLLTPRRRDDNGNDLWRTFNRVQENTIRGGLRAVTVENGQRRRVTSRPVKGIDQDVKLNRALWQLAQKMAELKAAA
jgi:hypothetical protein